MKSRPPSVDRARDLSDQLAHAYDAEYGATGGFYRSEVGAALHGFVERIERRDPGFTTWFLCAFNRQASTTPSPMPTSAPALKSARALGAYFAAGALVGVTLHALAVAALFMLAEISL